MHLESPANLRDDDLGGGGGKPRIRENVPRQVRVEDGYGWSDPVLRAQARSTLVPVWSTAVFTTVFLPSDHDDLRAPALAPKRINADIRGAAQAVV